MQSKATTVAAYLAALPAGRRAEVAAIRKVILANLDGDYEEGMQYGMISYFVPHRIFAAGYHCDPAQPLPFAGLAAQKNHLAVYMMGLYCGSPAELANKNSEAARFKSAWLAAGKKLDMGKACVRFRKLEDAALDVIGEAIRRMPAKTYIARYTAALASRATGKPAPKKAAARPARAKTSRR